MHAQAQEQHQWLSRLIGEWTYETEAIMTPGEPAMKFSGSEVVRSLGELWVLCEGQGEMPGGEIGHTIMTLGYDPRVGHFVGSFIGSMMTHLWIYEGALDATGRVLTLGAEGPSFTEEGKLARYRDVIEIYSADHRRLSSSALRDDGTWYEFMTAHVRRVGS